MAKAVIEKSVKVVLEMSGDEAEMLAAIIGQFAAGGITSNLYEELTRSGFIDAYKYRVVEGNSGKVVGTLKLIERN